MAFPVVKGLGFTYFLVMAGPAVIGICFILLRGLLMLLGKSTARIAKVTTAIAVLRAFPVSILVLCLLLPIYQKCEKDWLAKDTLTTIDPDAPDLGAYEFKVAAQIRKEINAIMEQ
jgi:hypothetical protein